MERNGAISAHARVVVGLGELVFPLSQRPAATLPDR